MLSRVEFLGEYMEPDLKTGRIVRLQVTTSCELSPDVGEAIARQSPPRNGQSAFWNTYVVGRTRYRNLLVVSLPTEKEKLAQIGLRYETAPGIRIPAKAPRVSSIIEEICAAGQDHTFTCAASFEYARRDKKRFIFNLPTRISESSFLPISTVDGLSFEGTVGSQKYSALVVSEEKGKYWGTLVFDKQYTFDSSLAEAVVGDFTRIVEVLFP